MLSSDATCREVLAQVIHSTGNFKPVAASIWPHVSVENAKTYLSKALASDEARFDVDWVITVCETTKNDDFLFWLCDRLGYMPPEKKPVPTLEIELKELRQFKKNIMKQMEIF